MSADQQKSMAEEIVVNLALYSLLQICPVQVNALPI